ncbi:MAG: hypothetical protein HRU28_00805 [Rhizobiales bacterium]|nr:hypothetical protein [Hyphomicrobiales bacterium]
MPHEIFDALKIIDNLYNSVTDEKAWKHAMSQFEELLQSDTYAEILIPHLNQAVMLRNKLNQHSQQIEGLEQILNRLNIGVLIVDKNLKVIFANQEASRYFLKFPNTFTINQENFLLSKNPSHNKLVKFISSIFSEKFIIKSNKYYSIRLDLGKQMNLIVLAILQKTMLARKQLLGESNENLLLFLCDTKSTPRSSEELIAISLGITITEAGLAKSLLDGNSSAEYAKLKGVSKVTARNQLQSIFAKTGINKQSELVKQLTKIFGFIK